MKRILFLFGAVFCLGACSVDDQELENANLGIQEVNATVSSDGCSITTFDYSTYGKIEVRNDRDFLYVIITATGNNTLTYTALEIAESYAQFPTVGKGVLKPENMEYQESFNVATNQHTFKYPISNFGQDLVIASYTTFGDGNSFWAGDVLVKQGNWAYFSYTVNEHPYNAGPDNSITLTVSQAKALPSWDEVRKLYASLLAPGVYVDAYQFEPSIWELIYDFNDPERETMVDEYSTTYTIGTGDCTDSVVLTVKVVADEQSL